MEEDPDLKSPPDVHMFLEFIAADTKGTRAAIYICVYICIYIYMLAINGCVLRDNLMK